MATTTHIKNIIKANKEQSLAIFIGAGISKSSETEEVQLPTWGALISDLKSELADETETDYLKLAQLYYLEFGEHTYYKKLKGYFPNNLKPSSTHRLIFEINPQVIITTNWDCLLEKAIEDNGYLYETIASDSDLVKSALRNKLLKMHGDFKSHNIVFKEDDYLNYQTNFPLIENYIKSILSTHTVLFIGYSYNDLNLKQISKWIQLQSNVRPPMYLTVYTDNKTQTKYLSNHGIATILLHEEDGKNNSYSERMYRFLEKIKQGFELTSPSSDEEICEYFLTKLKTLNKLDAVLVEQVRDAIENCGFLFEPDARAILEFYTVPMSFNASTLSIEAN